MPRTVPAAIVGSAFTGFSRLVTGVRGNWVGCTPSPEPRVYFANHSSHGDFVLIWAVLPAALRRRTRPVAGADYWNRSATRRYLGRDVFDAVLIERDPEARTEDPVTQMARALDDGASLILFPEGTRNTGEERLQPFKTGLYHLSRARPAVELVPVWIENLNRVMPKGEFLPVPLLCTVTFGAPIRAGEDEDKDAFLARARAALLALSEPEARR
ncbi:MAG TPA: lysophospholipid acyltransferase family protein [Methylomirabilota bacterium]|nr:lysophospholipid acyltransferase family protein [Methylomirabilota bacterium]